MLFYDDEGNRYGDWLHRQRRTRDSANEIVKGAGESEVKWYREPFWIIVFLVVICPWASISCGVAIGRSW